MGKKINRKLEKIYHALYGAFGPQHWWPGETPFEVAVGAILTQNTNWTNVERAIANLKKASALDPLAMHGMSEERLAELIRPSGYYNVKAKRLKAFISFLVEGYSGKTEAMSREETGALREKLLSIKGIGKETADSILLYALGKPVFVIDAYTKRVLSRHNVLSMDDAYDDFQSLFHSGLGPHSPLYNEYHALFVRTGKDFCRPGSPACKGCPIEGF